MKFHEASEGFKENDRMMDGLPYGNKGCPCAKHFSAQA